MIRTLGVLLFPGFETLDVFGPIEMFGQLSKVKIILISEKGKVVQSAHGQCVLSDYSFEETPHLDLILIPGGVGTRREVNNKAILDWLQKHAQKAEHILSVCTGAALLAKSNLLDNIEATSNKLALNWVIMQGPRVKWVKHARWVDSGKIITSSGVSAGIDMCLYVIARLFGEHTRNEITKATEYILNSDPSYDPFSETTY